MASASDQRNTAGVREFSEIENSHLAAVLFVDACGSSRIMRGNETLCLLSLRHEMNFLRQSAAYFDGEVRETRGDGMIVVFGSARDAVSCAVQMQNRPQLPDELIPIQFRIGVHIGEVFALDGNVSGHCINVTARIEALSEPNGILVSRPVFETLRGDSNFRFVSIGRPYLKNIGNDLELFQVVEGRGPYSSFKFDLMLLGTFALFGPDGIEISIPEDGKALITALALSPNGVCSRSWLSDILWDQSSTEERQNNLQILLLQLKDILADQFETLFSIEDAEIALHLGAVICDVTVLIEQDSTRPSSPLDLLERHDFKEGAFMRWLLHQRRRLRNARCLNFSKSSSLAHPVQQVALFEEPHRLPRKFAIGLLPSRAAGDHRKAEILADFIIDRLSKSLTDLEAVEIHDYRDARGRMFEGPNIPSSPGPDLMIQSFASSAHETVQIALNAFRPEDRKLIWSHSVMADQTEFLGLSGRGVIDFISHATDALLSALASGRHIGDEAAQYAAKTAIGAVHRLLTMTGAGLDAVQADLVQAYETDPRPIYLAWLSYIATFQVGERYGIRDEAFEEQARALARSALELDQHNALALGLVAHVHSYVFREFAFADDLISRALEINPSWPILWDSASLLYSYTGRHENAMSAGQKARRLGRHSPYRHLFDGACCVAAAGCGRFEDAVRFGESVIALQPEFKAVLRYLAASYGYLDETERAIAVMNKLMQLEPDLSIERLRDHNYPVPSTQCTQLIETGLSRFGLRKSP